MSQVVGPGEGHVFHNRLTHTLEAAQIARRIAQRLQHTFPKDCKRHGGLDADVAEAAALAHDIGHPPFGHVGEEALDEFSRDHTKLEGFEGNAQSFRVVTRLSARRTSYAGLNLTRATLNAILKYPWLRTAGERHDKFGVYADDVKAFQFAREGFEDGVRSVEAQVMDLADEIAYSVHDFDDFMRAGLIRLESLLHYPKALSEILEAWWSERGVHLAKEGFTSEDLQSHEAQFRNLLTLISDGAPYRGTFKQRANSRTWTSTMIDGYVRAIEPNPASSGDAFQLPHAPRIEMMFLQRLVWIRVILAPGLASQQAGQRRVIEDLYRFYLKAFQEHRQELIPASFLEADAGRGAAAGRLAADVVASFSDAEALVMHRRITGLDAGSVSDMLPA